MSSAPWNRDGHATELGKTLARIPADPRLGRALLDGAAAVGRRTAAEAVALVSGDQRAPGADLTRLLGTLRAGRDPAARRWAEDVRRMEAIARQEAGRRRTLCRVPAAGSSAGGRRLRRRPRLPGPGGAPRPGCGAGALPADLRHPGRPAGGQSAGRARMAGGGRGVPRGRARRGRDRRRHPVGGAAGGGDGRGRCPASAP